MRDDTNLENAAIEYEADYPDENGRCTECGESPGYGSDHADDCSLKPESKRDRFEREDNLRRDPTPYETSSGADPADTYRDAQVEAMRFKR